MTSSYIYNYTFQKKDRRDHLVASVPEMKIPLKVDLREEYNVPVLDQGDLGSCTAHASVVALYILLLKEVEKPYFPSRLFIYANSRILENTPLTEDSGANLRDVCKAIAQFKAPEETLWPYDISKFSIKPPQNIYTQALNIHDVEYKVIPQTHFRLRYALFYGYPIIFGVDIYESFESDSVANTGIVPVPNTATEKCLGGHALIMLGYDDSDETFLVQNSWGTNFGGSFGNYTRGYIKIPYSYILNPNLASDFWVLSKFE
jgi:C1A family cysteine protease